MYAVEYTKNGVASFATDINENASHYVPVFFSYGAALDFCRVQQENLGHLKFSVVDVMLNGAHSKA